MLESAGIFLTETEVPYFSQTVSKTLLGIVGTAHKGPLNEPTLIRSVDEFLSVFGKIDENSFGTYAAYQYLRNGNRLWYCRVANAVNSGSGTPAYAFASGSFTNFKLTAVTTGSWGNDISVRFTYPTGSDATLFNIEVFYVNSLGKKVLREFHKNLTLVTSSPNFIETRLGTKSGSVVTPNESSYIVAETLTSTTTRPAATAVGSYSPLTGGQSGLSPTIAEVVGTSVSGVTTGLQAFSSLEQMDVNVVCAPGFTEPEHVNALIALAEVRGDVIALLDPPQGLTVDEMVEWQLDYTSSRAAVYWPWVEVLSPDKTRSVFLPPSAVVAGQFAYNDTVGQPWFAPAGWNRGVITNAVGVEYNTTVEDRDALQSDENSVNPISYVRNRGVVIWGQKTLAREDSLVNRVNIRRLVLYLRKEIGSVASLLVFEQNDPSTWLRFKMMAEPILEAIQSNRGISNYRVIMDSTTTTAEDIRNNRMNGKIYIQPVEAAEYINIDFTLTPTGVDFDSIS